MTLRPCLTVAYVLHASAEDATYAQNNQSIQYLDSNAGGLLKISVRCDLQHARSKRAQTHKSCIDQKLLVLQSIDKLNVQLRFCSKSAACVQLSIASQRSQCDAVSSGFRSSGPHDGGCVHVVPLLLLVKMPSFHSGIADRTVHSRCCTEPQPGQLHKGLLMLALHSVEGAVESEPVWSTAGTRRVSKPKVANWSDYSPLRLCQLCWYLQ